MARVHSLIRLVLFVCVAGGLGYLVERDPGRVSLPLPDKGFTVSVPADLEGWRLERGSGDILVTGHTLLRTMSLEIAEIPVTRQEDLPAYMKQREATLKAGKQDYVVWHMGEDYKFGSRYAQAYKATYSDRFLITPFHAETWVNDVYWPYQGHFLRITMWYPDRLARYVEPDKVLLAAGLKEGVK